MIYPRICFVLLLFIQLTSISQSTTSSIGGNVKTKNGEPLAGATIQLVHEPTGTRYISSSNKRGDYFINNISPGGPYLLEISFIGFISDKRKSLFLQLGDALSFYTRLETVSFSIKNITVIGNKKNDKMAMGASTVYISKEKIEAIPSAGRNLQDYLRSVPQAKLVSGNEGAVSFAGQNNRYNAFYVDGAVNNDVFGLTASGTNGGQAGIAPLSIDAIEQFQIMLSPYDVSFGNFTGASINAVTRSGTNRTEGSVYHFFRNNTLTGKSILNADQPDFATQTSGIRLQGAFTPNRFFYFMNMELQRDRYPKTFDLSQYKGYTNNKDVLTILSNTLTSTYHYNAGSFLDETESINADRIVMRLDWNMNNQNKLSISNRYSAGQRINTNEGNSTTIHFSNDGFLLNSLTNATSLEWRTVIRKKYFNKLSVTFTSVTDNRGPIGKTFPRVRINDGDGAILFGTDNSSTINLLSQNNWTLFDKYSVVLGKHNLQLGIDGEYNHVYNAFIQNSFGNYTYSSISDFLTNQHPSAYQLGFSLIDQRNDDHTNASAKFSVLKTALFFNDDIKAFSNLSLFYGLRVEKYTFINIPFGDDSLNLIYLPILANYYNIQNTRSGHAPTIPISFSPRLGFLYYNSNQSWILKGGAGIFSGRIPLAWPGGIYQNNGVFIGGYSANQQQLNTIRFRPDANKQWTIAETGATINKEPLNLISEKFSMPTLFRTSLSIEKRINHNLTVSAEGIFSKNLIEIKYSNINLLPPVDTSSGPDKRFIYTLVNDGKIPINSNGTNPYDYCILLSNNKTQTGFAKSFSTTIHKKSSAGWNMELSYSYGSSTVVNEGTSSVNLNQWRLMETVYGRNNLTRSISDFSSGHILLAYLNKQFNYRDKRMAFCFSLSYTGQSGSPFSYVYGDKSMIRDDGIYNSYELLYIPTQKELSSMIFLPNYINGKTYSPEQQNEAFEKYLQKDPYLKNHRGQYAERNVGRTPFTHRVDIKMKQEFNLQIGKHGYALQLSLDIFNVGNLVNSNWGFQYQVPFDHFALLDFAGYRGTGTFIPQYRFNPAFLESQGPWEINTTNTPTYASHWSSQLGIRITFN